MLIERILRGYRETNDTLAPASPVVTISARRPAANAADYDRSEMQSRRLRRQRRLGRSATHRIGGWAVTTW